jgi:aspartate kinase
MVSVIASGHRRVPGIMAMTYETLLNARIAVHQIADSEMSVSFLLSEGEAQRAVRLLHERLFEK